MLDGLDLVADTEKAEQDFTSSKSVLTGLDLLSDDSASGSATEIDFIQGSPSGIATAPEPQTFVTPGLKTPEEARAEKLQHAATRIETAKKGGWIRDIPTMAMQSMDDIYAASDVGREVGLALFTGDDTNLKKAKQYRRAMRDISAEVNANITGPMGGKVLPTTVGFMAQMGAQMARSWDAALLGAGVGAGLGAAGVMTAPLTPLTTLGGASLGATAGTAREWYYQGVGDFYMDFVDAGIDDDTAKKAAMIGAVPYAMIEFISGWITPLRGLTEFAPIEKIATASIKQTALRLAWQHLKSTGAETIEESLQQLTQDATKNVAIDISNATKGTNLEAITGSEMWQNAVSAFTESFIPILLSGAFLHGPGSIRALNRSRQIKELQSKPQGEQGTQVREGQSAEPGAQAAVLSDEGRQSIMDQETEEKRQWRFAAASKDVDFARGASDKDPAYGWLKKRATDGTPISVDLEELELTDQQRDTAMGVRHFIENFTGRPVLFAVGHDVPGVNTPNAIWLNPTDPTKSLRYTGMHEAGHDIYFWAKKSDKHKAVVEEAMSVLRGSPSWEKYKNVLNQQGTKDIAIDDEAAASFFGMLLNDDEAMQEILRTNKPLYERIFEMVKEFFAEAAKAASETFGFTGKIDFTNPKKAQRDIFDKASMENALGDNYKLVAEKMISVARDFASKDASVAEMVVKMEAALKPPATSLRDRIKEVKTEREAAKKEGRPARLSTAESKLTTRDLDLDTQMAAMRPKEGEHKLYYGQGGPGLFIRESELAKYTNEPIPYADNELDKKVISGRQMWSRKGFGEWSSTKPIKRTIRNSMMKDEVDHLAQIVEAIALGSEPKNAISAARANFERRPADQQSQHMRDIFASLNENMTEDDVIAAFAKHGIRITPRFTAESVRHSRLSAVNPDRINPEYRGKAEAMEKAGKSREEIWRDLNMWRGPDGKWRFEVDDSDILISSERNGPYELLYGVTKRKTWSGKMGDMLSGRIMRVFPELGDIKVQVFRIDSTTPSGWPQSEVGEISPSGTFAKFYVHSVNGLRNIASHEIQHAIQKIEGFARGTSEKSDEVRAELQNFHIRQQREETSNVDVYNAFAGEAESRVVSRRLDMTPEQRKAEPPWVTMEKMLREEGLLKEGQKPEDVLITRGAVLSAVVPPELKKQYPPLSKTERAKMLKALEPVLKRVQTSLMKKAIEEKRSIGEDGTPASWDAALSDDAVRAMHDYFLSDREPDKFMLNDVLQKAKDAGMIQPKLSESLAKNLRDIRARKAKSDERKAKTTENREEHELRRQRNKYAREGMTPPRDRTFREGAKMGDTIQITGPKGNKTISYRGEDKKWWYGRGVKYAKADYTKGRKLDSPRVAVVRGRALQWKVFQLKATDVNEGSSKIHFIAAETKGEYTKGVRYERDAGAWWVQETEGKPANITENTQLWGMEKFLGVSPNEAKERAMDALKASREYDDRAARKDEELDLEDELDEEKMKKYLRAGRGQRIQSVSKMLARKIGAIAVNKRRADLIEAIKDAGAEIENYYTEVLREVVAHDAALMENIPDEIKRGRLNDLIEKANEKAEKLEDDPYGGMRYYLVEGEKSVKDLSEDELRQRLVIDAVMGARITGKIKEIRRRLGREKSLNAQKRDEDGHNMPSVYENQLAILQAQEYAARAAARDVIERSKEATVKARTEAKAAVKAASESISKGADLQTLLAEAMRWGEKENRYRMEPYILEDPEVVFEILSDMHDVGTITSEVYNDAIPKLRAAYAVMQRTATSAVSIPERERADKAAMKLGYASAAMLRKRMKLPEAKAHAKRLLNGVMDQRNDYQFHNVANVLADHVVGKSKHDPEATALLNRMIERQEKFAAEVARSLATRLPSDGKKSKSYLEYTGRTGSSPMQALLNQIAVRLSGVRKGPVVQNDIDLARGKAMRTMDMVSGAIEREMIKKYGDTPAARSRAAKMVQDIWKEVGTPLAHVKVIKNGVDESIDSETIEYQSRLSHAIEARLATRADKFIEYWKSLGLLSGIATMIQNPVSNIVRQVYEYGPKQPLQDLFMGRNPLNSVSAITRMAPLMGEFSRRAFQIAKIAFDAEVPVLGRVNKSGFIEGSKFDVGHVQHAFKGGLGRGIRLPFRVLSGGDELTKAYDMQVGLALEYFHMSRAGVDARTGQLTNKFTPSVKDVGEFIDWAFKNTDKQIVQDALGRAIEHAWQNENKYAKPISSARSAVPHGLGNLVLPFVNTPMNILTQSLRMSPAGVVHMGVKAVRNAIARKDNPMLQRYWFGNREFASNLAEQVIAWGLVAVISKLIASPDDDDKEWLPHITGGQPSYRLSRGETGFKRQMAMPPMHIRIGNKMYDYSRIEPFATLLPVIIDFLHAAKDAKRGEDVGKAVAGAFSSAGVAITDRSFLSGVHDLISAAEEPDRLATWTSNFAASWVPNVFRQTMNAFDPYARDLTAKGERYSKEWIVSLASKTGAKAFPNLPAIIRQPPPPQYDYWGQPVKKVSGDTPSTDVVYRLLSIAGVKIKTRQDQDLNRMILNWNQRSRFEGLRQKGDPKVFAKRFFDKPSRYISIGENRDGKQVNHYLTDDEYQEYIRTSGQIALARASRMSFNYDNPTVRDINRLATVVEMSRRIARNRIKTRLRREGKI